MREPDRVFMHHTKPHTHVPLDSLRRNPAQRERAKRGCVLLLEVSVVLATAGRPPLLLSACVQVPVVLATT